MLWRRINVIDESANAHARALAPDKWESSAREIDEHQIDESK